MIGGGGPSVISATIIRQMSGTRWRGCKRELGGAASDARISGSDGRVGAGASNILKKAEIVD